MTIEDTASRSGELAARHLPALRRYARALTGSQDSGDRYAATSFEALAQDPATPATDAEAKLALFRAFHLIWSSTGAPTAPAEEAAVGARRDHLAGLTPNAREALLLYSIEGFAPADVARIIGIEQPEAEALIEVAVTEMQAAAKARVMIIEDEAIIAMDLHSIVTGMGHEVVGIARTRAAAVEMGAAEAPDLILADIQLADNSSGIDAVNELMGQFGAIPVVFVTAFPERLLTGEKPEPAFLISKPYSEDQLRSAVGQALLTSGAAAPD